MSKAAVFISHITSEHAIAIAFKRVIESAFLGMIDVFVSSDGESISMGRKWMSEVSDSLKRCAAEILICSPASVSRPWINFEAGAGWIRDIPVIPICHSGINPSSLPSPLSYLQAATATDSTSLARVLLVLAESIGSRVPDVDFEPFVKEVHRFEDSYAPRVERTQALQTIEGTPFDFPGVFRIAQNRVFLADQNFYDFVKPESVATNKSIIAEFLNKNVNRRVQVLLCDPECAPAVDTWTSIQRPEYMAHLKHAISVLKHWTSDKRFARRFEVRTTSFVPLTLAVVDPDDQSALVAVIPNPYEVKWSRRACFVIQKQYEEEIFMSYWGGYFDRFQNSTPLRAEMEKNH